jgi:GNAT superfamily N-acetyltransferase
MNGIIYSDITRYPTFIHIASSFKDLWYNFIFPTTNVDQFDWDSAFGVIKEQKNIFGKQVSFYIHSTLDKNFQEMLSKNKYSKASSDVYMYKRLEEETNESDLNNYKLETVDKTNEEQYLEMSQLHFPDWENGDKYTRRCLEMNGKVDDKESVAFLLKVNNTAVSSGGIILSPKSNLAYLHNVGTLAEFRRKGYFSIILQKMCAYAKSKGINEVFSIVEEDSASYHGHVKIGFEKRDVFYVYTKE